MYDDVRSTRERDINGKTLMAETKPYYSSGNIQNTVYDHNIAIKCLIMQDDV